MSGNVSPPNRLCSLTCEGCVGISKDLRLEGKGRGWHDDGGMANGATEAHVETGGMMEATSLESTPQS